MFKRMLSHMGKELVDKLYEAVSELKIKDRIGDLVNEGYGIYLKTFYKEEFDERMYYLKLYKSVMGNTQDKAGVLNAEVREKAKILESYKLELPLDEIKKINTMKTKGLN